MNSTDVQYILDTVSEFETFGFIYSRHCYIMCVVNTLLTIIALYYIKYLKVQSNFELKPLAFYNITCCWALITFTTLHQPVSLANLKVGFTVGVGAISGHFWLAFGFWITWVVVLQLGAISTFGFLLQFSRMQVIKTNFFIRILQWFNTNRKIWLFLHSTFAFHFILILIPAVSLFINSENLSDQNLSFWPKFEKLVSENPSFVISKNDVSSLVTSFITFIFALVFVELIFACFINFFTLRAIQSTKLMVQKATFRRQLLIYKLFSAQILLNLIFFHLPVFVAAIVKMKGWYSIYFLPLSVTLIIWHFPTQFLLNLTQLPKLRKLFGGGRKIETFSIVTRT